MFLVILQSSLQGQIKGSFSPFYNICSSYTTKKQMRQRKVWTAEEDKVLKLLIQDRGMTKWAQISQIMEKQFEIQGRNGKQCRQRYHNHLDRNISSQEWTQEEENQLFQFQNEYGNKWALIANKLSGRSDNCVKNHFYSKLRKGLRKINKKINKYMKREYKDIKTSTLYRIIQTMQTRNRSNSLIDDQTVDLCRSSHKIITEIKDKLRQYDDSTIQFQDQNDQINFIRPIIEDLAVFDKDILKSSKKGSAKGSIKITTKRSDQSQLKPKSNKLSTKSMYDEEEQSEYSNSDIFSSSSFDHKSFGSKRSNKSSQLLKPLQLLHRSQSIQSESEDQSEDQRDFLYKSANSVVEHTKSRKKQDKREEIKKQERLLTTNSLKLPLPVFGSTFRQEIPKEFEQLEMKQQSSRSVSSSSNKSNSAKNQNMIFKYMMGGDQPFEMKILTPKELTFKQKIQMHSDQDDLFYGQQMEMDIGMDMELEAEDLVSNFNGLSLDQMPKLGRSHDI